MLAVQAPYPIFTDTNGDPLDAGFLYFGSSGQNPETAPITVYWDLAGTQPVAQPVRTLNGKIARAGTPARVYTPSDYSMTVRNAQGVLVSYAASAPDFAAAVAPPLWATYPGTPTYVGPTQFTLVGDQTATFPVGTRVRSTVTAGTAYSTVSAVVFAATTTVTLVNDSTALDSGLSAVATSIATIAEKAIGAASIAFPSTVNFPANTVGAVVKAVTQRVTQLETPPVTTGTSTNYVLTHTVPSATLANGVWMVRFHVASGAGPTLNIDALGGKALKQFDSAGNKVDAVIPLNLIALVAYDGTDLIVGSTKTTSVDTVSGAVTLSALPSFGNSLAANGYQKLPGGIIIQWGTQVVSASSSATFTFPVAFTTTLAAVQIAVKNNPYLTQIECDLTCTAQTLTSVTINNEYVGDSSGTQNALTAQILAIGW